MKPCNVIQVKLGSGQSLADDQQVHLETCQDCRRVMAAIETIESSAAAAHALAEPSAAEVNSVQQILARRARPPRAGFRLLWAGAAMVLGVFLAIGILSSTLGPDNLDQSEEKLIALLDEVSEIADPDPETSTGSDELEGLYIAQVLMGDDTRVDTDLQLPESYQLLEQALENDWL